MATVQNSHTLQYGTEHGCIGIGVCNTYSNQIDAVKISNGPDAGRHYIRMQETGSKEDGSKGSTHIVCPGTFTALTGKDIVNYPEGSDEPRGLNAILFEAENGDIVLTAPRGKIKIAAEAIELIAEGSDGRTGVIDISASEKINLKSQMIDLNSGVSTKIFSEDTVHLIGKSLLNIYGGLADFADGTTKRRRSKLSEDDSVLSKNEVENAK
tara:strand:+ start:1171 stop:1803 length:633 start_codon:yes stop_codon:yes gene_type:complete